VGRTSGKAEIVDPQLNGYRLTPSSGTPVPTTDQLAVSTLYLTPYKGDAIALWDGSTWIRRTPGEVSLNLDTALAGAPLTASSIFDVFAYDAAGTVTLEALVWASSSARATALVYNDGVLSKTGDLTRRWVGTIRTTAVAGDIEVSNAKTYLDNADNRVDRVTEQVDPTASWTLVNAVVWRGANNGNANWIHEYVVGWLGEVVHGFSGVYVNTVPGGQFVSFVHQNNATTINPQAFFAAGTPSVAARMFSGITEPAVGYAKLVTLENSGGTGTTTIQGSGNASHRVTRRF